MDKWTADTHTHIHTYAYTATFCGCFQHNLEKQLGGGGGGKGGRSTRTRFGWFPSKQTTLATLDEHCGEWEASRTAPATNDIPVGCAYACWNVSAGRGTMAEVGEGIAKKKGCARQLIQVEARVLVWNFSHYVTVKPQWQLSVYAHTHTHTLCAYDICTICIISVKYA